MNTRKCGSEYEERACRYLEAQNYIVLERNFRCKFGEIDIIALEKDTMAFIEVKYRRSISSGYPEEAVAYSKQKKISLTADYYCLKNEISEKQNCRFDVIAIDNDKIRHYKNAFMYMGSRY